MNEILFRPRRQEPLSRNSPHTNGATCMATSNDHDIDRGPAMPDRRHFLAAGLGLAAAPLLTHVAADTPLSQHPEVHMEIKRSGSQPSRKGPADWFTGTVRIDPLFQVHAPARAAGASVTFEPGRPDGVAHPPAGADPDHHGRLRLGPAGGRPGRGSPSRRRGLVPAGREALARCHADHGHDAYRHPGTARRQGRRLAGARERRTVPQVSVRLARGLQQALNKIAATQNFTRRYRFNQSQ